MQTYSEMKKAFTVLPTRQRHDLFSFTNNDIKHTHKHNLYIEFIQFFFWIDGPCTLVGVLNEWVWGGHN